MNHNNEYIEQLRQELLSQDPSLGGQKETYIRLIERMSSHIPEVPIDKNFQNNLKSKLEHHISYINNLKENPPQVHPKINRLARLISYGLPTIALGVIIFLALPGTPNQVIAPTLDNSPINIQSGETQQDKEKQTTLGGTSQNINYNRTNQNNTEPASTTDIKEIPMMMQEVSSLKSQDTNTSQDTQTLSPKTANNNLEARSAQNFSDNNFSITYSLESAGGDIVIKGSLSDGNCKSQYNFSQTLIGVSKDGSITLSATLDGTKTSQSFTIKFQDNSIISIQGEHICQITRETK